MKHLIPHLLGFCHAAKILRRGRPLLLLLAVTCAVPLSAAPIAPAAIWKPVADDSDLVKHAPSLRPGAERTFTALRIDLLKQVLAQAPVQGTPKAAAPRPTIELPLPSGKLASFHIEDSPIQDAAACARYPNIKTYRATGTGKHAHLHGRFTMSQRGLHAYILGDGPAICVTCIDRETKLYVSHYESDLEGHAPASCETCEELSPSAHNEPANRKSRTAPTPNSGYTIGDTLRVFKIVILATGEWSRIVTSTDAPTPEELRAAVLERMTAVNAIYGSELGILFQVVDAPELLFTDPEGDPFEDARGKDQPNTPIDTVNTVYDDYVENGGEPGDLGHLFMGNHGGGQASIRSVCTDRRAMARSGAVTGIPTIYHEIGHQFGATHTFNVATGFEGVAGWPEGSAVEPGAGRTIMSYANLSPDGSSNDYGGKLAIFSWKSFESINEFLTGPLQNCGTVVAQNNHPPSIAISSLHTAPTGSQPTLPIETPFLLDAVASDPDNDPLTVSWESMDMGSEGRDLDWGDDGFCPLFGVVAPTSETYREFLPSPPDPDYGPDETFVLLPSLDRTSKFRATVRDGEGGVASIDYSVHFDSSVGPFEITSPGAGDIRRGEVVVTWNPAGTSTHPAMMASRVDIRLSLDGGQSFTQTLASNTPNDGSERVYFPNVPTNTARLRIIPTNHFFFAESEDFTIFPLVTPALFGAVFSESIFEGEAPTTTKTYTIQGYSSIPVEWTIDVGADWVTLNHPEGLPLVVPAGGIRTMTVGFDPSVVAGLPTGIHETTLTFHPDPQVAPFQLPETRLVRLEIKERFLIETFQGDFDLHNKTIRFVPNASQTRYAAFVEPTAGFPIDPVPGSSEIAETSKMIAAPLGSTFTFFGVAYSSFEVFENGHLRFANPAMVGAETEFGFYKSPSVAAGFQRVGNRGTGRFGYQYLPDRLVITWQELRFGISSLVNCQVALCYDGSFEVTNLTDPAYALFQVIGISPGYPDGLPSYFSPIDFSAAPSPEAAPEIISPVQFLYFDNTPVDLRGISISDPDTDVANEDFTVRIFTGPLTFGSFHLAENVPGGVPDFMISGNGTGLVEINAPLDWINTTLAAPDGLQFTFASNGPQAAALHIVATDNSPLPGGPRSASASIGGLYGQLIANQPPIIHVNPPDQIVDALPSQPIVGISVYDDGQRNVLLSIFAPDGSLEFTDTIPGGVGPSEYAFLDPGHKLLQINAPLEKINTTLGGSKGLFFTPDPGFTGEALIGLAADDLGNGGEGGPLLTNAVINLQVVPVPPNQAPSIQAPGNAISVPLGVPGFIDSLRIIDPDAGTGQIRVAFEVTHGQIGISTSIPGGIRPFELAVAEPGKRFQVQSTLARINTTLAAPEGLAYSAPPRFLGCDPLLITVSDLGNSGSGGAQIAQRTICLLPDASPYELWLYEHFSIADLSDPVLEESVWGTGADWDGDLATTLEEFHAGFNPTLRDARNDPDHLRLERLPGGQIGLRYREAIRADGIVQAHPEVATDLLLWERNLAQVFVVDADHPKVRYLLAVIPMNGSRGFLRLAYEFALLE